MDRISALRNVEEALTAFESGDADLAATEARVAAVLRTYASDFDADGVVAYRATAPERVAGVVVVADSAAEARDRVVELYGDDVRPVTVERP